MNANTIFFSSLFLNFSFFFVLALNLTLFWQANDSLCALCAIHNTLLYCLAFWSLFSTIFYYSPVFPVFFATKRLHNIQICTEEWKDS